jgi:hypothetical protein
MGGGAAASVTFRRDPGRAAAATLARPLSLARPRSGRPRGPRQGPRAPSPDGKGAAHRPRAAAATPGLQGAHRRPGGGDCERALCPCGRGEWHLQTESGFTASARLEPARAASAAELGRWRSLAPRRKPPSLSLARPGRERRILDLGDPRHGRPRGERLQPTNAPAVAHLPRWSPDPGGAGRASSKVPRAPRLSRAAPAQPGTGLAEFELHPQHRPHLRSRFQREFLCCGQPPRSGSTQTCAAPVYRASLASS